jgi:ribosomal protein S18 acetylase RimI-like enzyme
MLDFKKATIKDIPILLNIEKQCFSKDIRFTENTYLSLFRNNDNIIDLIIYDNDIVGVIAIVIKKYTGLFFPGKIFSVARLCNLALLPEYQGKGIAKQTLNHYLNKLSNFNHIFLEVDMENKKAIQLYKKCGFQHYKTLQNYYGVNKHAFKMKKVRVN